MIYTMTLNPAVDRTLVVPSLQIDSVNRAAQARVDAGGKGINVSRWIHALGGESVAMAILGGDSGQFIARTLAADGIETDCVWAQADTRTNIKLIDADSQTNTDINEPGAPVTPAVLEALQGRLLDRLAPGDWVVLAGKLPPGVGVKAMTAWMRAMQAKGAKLIVDMEKEALEAALDCAPYLAKPNDVELSSILRVPLDTVAAVADAARALQARGLVWAVVSMGGRGAMFADGQRTLHAPALSVRVGSTVGAGDAMVAALAYALSEGWPLDRAARLAMAAGAASVMQPGTGVAPKTQVDALAMQVALQQIS